MPLAVEDQRMSEGMTEHSSDLYEAACAIVYLWSLQNNSSKSNAETYAFKQY